MEIKISLAFCFTAGVSDLLAGEQSLSELVFLLFLLLDQLLQPGCVSHSLHKCWIFAHITSLMSSAAPASVKPGHSNKSRPLFGKSVHFAATL